MVAASLVGWTYVCIERAEDFARELVGETIAEMLSQIPNLISVHGQIAWFASLFNRFSVWGNAFYGLSFLVFHPISAAMAIPERRLRTQAAMVYAHLHAITLSVHACIA